MNSKEIKEKVLKELKYIKTLRHRDPVDRIINYTTNTNKFSNENLTRMKQFIDINDKYRKYKFDKIFPYFYEVLEHRCKTLEQ